MKEIVQHISQLERMCLEISLFNVCAWSFCLCHRKHYNDIFYFPTNEE